MQAEAKEKGANFYMEVLIKKLYSLPVIKQKAAEETGGLSARLLCYAADNLI